MVKKEVRLICMIFLSDILPHLGLQRTIRKNPHSPALTRYMIAGPLRLQATLSSTRYESRCGLILDHNPTLFLN